VPPSDDRAPRPPRRLPPSSVAERRSGRGSQFCRAKSRSMRSCCHASNHRQSRRPRVPARVLQASARPPLRDMPQPPDGRCVLEKEARETLSSTFGMRGRSHHGSRPARAAALVRQAGICNVGASSLVPLWHSAASREFPHAERREFLGECRAGPAPRSVVRRGLQRACGGKIAQPTSSLRGPSRNGSENGGCACAAAATAR
jgi:hypothetical protein